MTVRATPPPLERAPNAQRPCSLASAATAAAAAHRAHADPCTCADLLAVLEEMEAPPQPPHSQPQQQQPPQQQRNNRRAGAGGVAASEAVAQPPPPAAEEEPTDPHRCHFCGVYDETFNEEKLDLHFWKDCAMLMCVLARACCCC